MNEKRFLKTENFGHKDVFEIVEEFPNEYVIWNIGRHNFPFVGYLPLARPSKTMPYHIERSDLKTIKVSEAFAEWLMKIVSKGSYGTIGKGEFLKLRKRFSLINEL